MKQEIMRWQWHQLDHMQIICALRQITSPAPHRSIFYQLDALADDRSTVLKH